MQKEVNNDYLIDFLISNAVLKNESLIKAFRKIDRKDFVLFEKGSDFFKTHCAFHQDHCFIIFIDVCPFLGPRDQFWTRA